MPKNDGSDAPGRKIDVSIVRVLFAGKSAPSGLNSSLVFGGQRRVVISGNRGLVAPAGVLVASMVSIATAGARMPVSVRLPVLALVVFKVGNIVGELRPGVCLVPASTVVVRCWRVAEASSSARRRGSGSRRMRWN